MRRVLALLAVLCCLLTLIPFAAAEPLLPEPEATVEEPLLPTEETEMEETEGAEEETAPTEETDKSQTLGEDETSESAEPLPEGGKLVLQTQKEDVDLAALEGETSILTVEVTAALDDAGRVTVTQKMEMNIVGEVEELRFSVPEHAKKARIIGYHTGSKRENNVRYLTIKAPRDGFAARETFELYYTLSEVVSEGEQSQILTLPLLSLQDYRIGKYTFAVAMPELFNTTPRFASGYYDQLVEEIMTVRVEEKWIVGVMKEIVRDNDSLRMELVVPEGYFSGNHGDSGLPKILSWVSLGLLAIAMLYWLRTLRNPPLKVRSRSLPPDGIDPGDLPFILSGGNTDFNMLVSYWATLGYLSIHVKKNGRVLLRRRMDMGNERRKIERKLFDLLFVDSDICEGAGVRYKRVGEKAMQVVRKYWCRRLYVKHSGSPVLVRGLCWIACALASFVAIDAVAPAKGHGFFLLLALVAGLAMGVMLGRVWGCFYMNDAIQTSVGAACGIFMLILGVVGEASLCVLPAIIVTVFLGQQTCHGGMRCPYGDEIVSQVMGFRRFMLRVSEHHVLQMQVRDPQYFYKMLPYAEAMGMGRKFVNLFHDCRLEPCQWYDASRKAPVSATAFYESYCDTLDLLNMSIRQ